MFTNIFYFLVWILFLIERKRKGKDRKERIEREGRKRKGKRRKG